MKKTIAIIGTLDTKEEEVKYLKDSIEKMGLNTFIIDVGYTPCSELKADVTREQVMQSSKMNWKDPLIQRKDIINGLADGMENLLPKLYKEGFFHGVISAGGAQNTIIATRGMQKLPLGVPKVMVSTVASGDRKFRDIVGTKDIVVIPSIADIAGINIITSMIMNNAVAAVVGMTSCALELPTKKNTIRIGSTLMGVVDKGSKQVNKLMKQQGFEVTNFHSTGVGGKIFEELILENTFDLLIDFSLHEITSEYFGKGYSLGANNRLKRSATITLPQVIVPGAVDFIDFAPEDIPNFMKDRKMQHHNEDIVHVKVSVKEIKEVGEIICQRLNSSPGLITVVIPLRGFRQQTQEGEVLYDKEVDQALIQVLTEGLDSHIKCRLVDANINDIAFTNVVAEEAINLLKETAQI